MKFSNGTKFLLVFTQALIMLAPTGLSAQESIIVAVKPDHPSGRRAASYVRQQIRLYFQQDDRYKNINIEDMLGSNRRKDAQKSIEIAKSIVQKGHEAYDSLELDQAIDYFNNAIRKYEQNTAYMDSPRPISEALIALGAAYILRGEEVTGRKVLTKAVLIDQLAKPDPRIFNPSMMEIFNAAQELALNSGRGAINVISNPNYADVFLDGKFIGVTPLSRGDISGGQHYVQLKKDGYRTYGKPVTIHAHAEESVSSNLRTIPGNDMFERLSVQAVSQIDNTNVHPSIKELAAFARTQYVFVAEVKLDGELVKLKAAQFSTEADRRLKAAETTFLFDPDQFEEIISEFMAQHFGASSLYEDTKMFNHSTVPTGSTEKVTKYISSNTRKKKNIITWSLIGSGSLLAGIGGVTGALTLKKADDYKTSIQVLSEDTANSGKTMALMTDILVGVGLTAAITGTMLLLFWDPTPSADSLMEQAPTTSPPPFQGGIAPIAGGAMVTINGSF